MFWHELLLFLLLFIYLFFVESSFPSSSLSPGLGRHINLSELHFTLYIFFIFLTCWPECLSCRWKQWARRERCQQNHHLPSRGCEVWLWAASCAGQLWVSPLRWVLVMYLRSWVSRFYAVNLHIKARSDLWVKKACFSLFYFAVVLMENGDVYTFGYGQHGQLGHGDVNSRYSLFFWNVLFVFQTW